MTIIPRHRSRAKLPEGNGLFDQLAADIQPTMRPTGVAATKLPCTPGTGRDVLDELIAADRPKLCAYPLRRPEPTVAERLAGIGLLYATRHASVSLDVTL